MQLFAKGIFDSVKATFRRWRRAIPQLFRSTSPAGFGTDVAISGDGKTIVVFDLKGNYNSIASSIVTIYKIEPDGSSLQVGQTFTSPGNPIGFGQACALNFDGTRLAISSPFFNRATLQQAYTGRVQIYDLVGNQWILNATLLGIGGTSQYNYTISFNDSGSRIVFLVNSILNARYYQVYEFNGTTWAQLGDTIYNSINSNAKNCANLNALGNRVATTNSVFELQNGVWVQLIYFPTISGNTGYPNFYDTDDFPNIIILNATGDKFAVLQKKVIFSEGQIPYYYVELFHEINSAWILKTQKIILPLLYTSVNSSGIVSTTYVESIAFPRVAQDGNKILLCGTYIDPDQIILPGNASIVSSNCIVLNYNETSNEFTQDAQMVFSKRSSVIPSGGSCADISRDGKTFVFGKRSDARIGSIFSTQTYGVVDVFRKQLN